MVFKKIISLFLLFAYAVGAIGGFGVSAYTKEYFIAGCVLVLAAMAFPFAKKTFKFLSDGDAKS